MKTEFTRAQLDAAASCMSTDNSRPMMCGARVETTKLVATDGHRIALVATTGDPTDTTSAFIARDEVTRLKKMGGANAKFSLTLDDGYFAVRVDGHDAGRIATGPADGFPDYSRLLPSDEPKHVVALSARYLSEIAAAAGKVSTNPDGYVLVEFRDELSPVRFVSYPYSEKSKKGRRECDTGRPPALVGLVMPMRR